MFKNGHSYRRKSTMNKDYFFISDLIQPIQSRIFKECSIYLDDTQIKKIIRIIFFVILKMSKVKTVSIINVLKSHFSEKSNKFCFKFSPILKDSLTLEETLLTKSQILAEVEHLNNLERIQLEIKLKNSLLKEESIIHVKELQKEQVEFKDKLRNIDF